MRSRLLLRGIPLLLLASFSLTGCAWLKSKAPGAVPAKKAPPPAMQPPPPAMQPPPPAKQPPLPAQQPPPPAEQAPLPAVSPADKAFAEGMTALQDGGQELALERFSAAWKEQPGHPGVAREFEGALQALKKNGDAAYAQGKWEDAGRRWMGTLRHIGHPAVKPKAVPFSRADVQAQVDRLSSWLMEKGLLEYRKGNIEAAIPHWKTILAYDPAHQEAARSVATASKQLENLKKIPAAR